MYEKHPSSELQRLFRERPYQGADPCTAHFIFLGLDANYAATLELTPTFGSVLEYHRDGVSFWRRYGVHHPFLLPSYRGDGRRYHLNFARIGFTASDADKVCFLELLHVPTIGRSKLDVPDLEDQHLTFIDSLVTSRKPRLIFLSAGVARLMRASGRFRWLQSARQESGLLPVLHSDGDAKVFLHLHFSNYGKFQEQLDREACAIGRLTRDQHRGM